MKKILIILLGFCFLAVNGQTNTKERIKWVNAKDYGAKADGKTDDTKSIQLALDAAETKGGICFLEAGTYRLNGTLVVPGGVTLKGSYEAIPHGRTPVGTIIEVYGGKGDENATPTITLNYNASVRDVLINYPEQQSPPNIIPYPWTIRIAGELCQVIDVNMTNPYMAIDAGTNGNELHVIRNVFACPLKIGVYVDRCTDIGRLENIHFNPNFWKRSSLRPKLPTPPASMNMNMDAYWNSILIPYLKENLIGFKIGKTDWEYITNCFVIFAKEGFVFDDYGYGPGNALVTQSGSDIGPVAIQVNRVQERQGIQFVNCQIMATVNIAETNTGPVKISNSGFWRTPDITLEQVINKGSGTVFLNNCQFTDWDMPKVGAPCIRMTNGRLILSNCDFFQKEKKSVKIEDKFISGTITGCIFRGPKVENTSTGKLEMSGNVFE